jgi:hypothetical protein
MRQYLFLDCFLYDTLDATLSNPWRRSMPISPAICRSICFNLRCQSASAACKLRQVVIGSL